MDYITHIVRIQKTLGIINKMKVSTKVLYTYLDKELNFS